MSCTVIIIMLFVRVCITKTLYLCIRSCFPLHILSEHIRIRSNLIIVIKVKYLFPHILIIIITLNMQIVVVAGLKIKILKVPSFPFLHLFPPLHLPPDVLVYGPGVGHPPHRLQGFPFLQNSVLRSPPFKNTIELLSIWRLQIMTFILIWSETTQRPSRSQGFSNEEIYPRSLSPMKVGWFKIPTALWRRNANAKVITFYNFI